MVTGKINDDDDDRYVLSPQQCRILLTDIACCSLMRLDITSMDKLWDLMLMVFKWQLSLIAVSDPQGVLDLTFRHMDGIGRLLPEMRKTLLIDCTKRHLIEYWDSMLITERITLQSSLLRWVRPYNVKISILIRLGFQNTDGGLISNEESEFFQYYADHVGENIYTKHAYVTSIKTGAGRGAEKCRLSTETKTTSKSSEQSHEIDSLASQLNVCQRNVTASSSKDIRPNDILEEVSFDMNSFNQQRLAAESGDSMFKTEFVNIDTVSTIDSILESFSLDFIKARGDAGIVEEFDATRELLKLLDES